MLGKRIFFIWLLSIAFLLAGCTVRTYKLTRDRVDQDLASGNRGYLMGKPTIEDKERKKTRITQAVEIELGGKGVKFEGAPQEDAEPGVEQPLIRKEKLDMEKEEPVLKQEYLMKSPIPEVKETAVSAGLNVEKYTVQKDDTLQKISQKFFGTTKKWIKIYEANKDTLSGPDKIFPGQVINIPLDETREGMK